VTTLPRQDGSGGAAGELITPPPRAVLGIRVPLPITGFNWSIVSGFGDPSDSGPTVGTLAGTPHDAETDALSGESLSRSTGARVRAPLTGHSRSTACPPAFRR
jgi:hypothetical protein